MFLVCLAKRIFFYCKQMQNKNMSGIDIDKYAFGLNIHITNMINKCLYK